MKMKKLLSVLCVLMMMTLMMGSASASTQHRISDGYSYNDYLNRNGVASWFGFSIAKPSSISTLIKIEYEDEVLTNNLFELELDTGHIDYIYFEPVDLQIDVGDDGIYESDIYRTDWRAGSMMVLIDVPESICNINTGSFSRTTVGSGYSSTCVINLDNHPQESITFLYELTNSGTYNGVTYVKGVYFQGLPIANKFSAVREGINQYMTDNCQDTDKNRCVIPIKVNANSIKNVVVHYSTFLQDYVCDIGAGNQMVVETFSAGKSVSMYSFRYPVHHFCPSNPVLIIDDKEAKSTSDAKMYFDLQRGEIITVPDDQTYVFYYVMKNNGEIPLTCRDMYDPETGTCTPRVGIVFLCSEGIWSSDIHACVVTPESMCNQGVYDEDLMKCVWHPPRQAICDETAGHMLEWVNVRYNNEGYANGYCPDGSTFSHGATTADSDDYCMYENKRVAVMPYKPASNAIYNIDTQRCEWVPLEKTECENQNAVYDSSEKICKYHPAEYIFCDMPGSTYDKNSDKCVYKPTILAKCDEGGVYNEYSGFCEVEKPTKLICKDFPGATWNPQIGMCEYIASTKKVCGDKDGIYDESLDKCLVTADFKYVCDAYGEGAIWDDARKVCVKNADIEYKCTKGTYDSVSNTCKVNPNIENICTEGTYIASTGMCHKYPEIKTVCPPSFTYDEYYQTCSMKPVITCPGDAYYSEKTGMCVREPSIDNFCENGKYDASKDKCVWYPQVEIVCGDKGVYDEESQICVETGDVIIRCERGTESISETGEVVCVVNPDEVEQGGIWMSIKNFFKILFFI